MPASSLLALDSYKLYVVKINDRYFNRTCEELRGALLNKQLYSASVQRAKSIK